MIDDEARMSAFRKALAATINPSSIVLDLGAGTGIMALLACHCGAKRVYAVEPSDAVQIARETAAKNGFSDRIVCIQQPSASVTLPEPVDLAVVDVSFISLGLVLGPIRSVLRNGAGPILALVKPQFEAGRADAKGGVVRDPDIHRRVLRETVATAAGAGLGTRAVIASPILGPEGNREFMIHLQAGPSCAEIDERIEEAVTAAWEGGA